MMPECYNVYFKPGEFAWPSQIIDRFSDQSKSGSYDFVPGSSEDAQFVQMCVDLGLQDKVARTEICGCAKEDVSNFPFFYLSTSQGDYTGPPILDFRTGCPVCHYGLVQRTKATLNPSLARRIDIISFSPPRTRWVVTRRTKDLIESTGLTGVVFSPCLRTDREYSSEETLFGTTSESLETNAAYFQMDWTAETSAHVGKVTIRETCPECHRVKSFYDDLLEGKETYLKREELQNSDFQWFTQHLSSHQGQFVCNFHRYIISGKALQILLDHGIKGIARDAFLTSAPRYQIVNIE